MHLGTNWRFRPRLTPVGSGFSGLWLTGLILCSCSGGEHPVLQIPVAEVEPGETQLLHYPRDGQEAGVNPPGFTWTDSQAADTYELLLFRGDPSAEAFRQLSGLRSTIGILDQVLPAGRYSWVVVYRGRNGLAAGRSRLRTFSVAADAPELLFPEMESLKNELVGKRPRLFLTPLRLATIQQSLAEGRISLWSDFQDLLDRGMKEKLYPEPEPYADGEWTTPEWRRIYTPAKVGTSHMVRMALAYRLTGEDRYLQQARDWLLHFASWDPRGIASHDVPQADGTEGNDEASMPMLERMSIVYDWIEPQLSEAEKDAIRACMTERGNQVLALLHQQDFLSRPFENHEGRVLAFLGLAGLSFLGEIPDAERWLDYVLRCYLTSFPVWGGDDGDWAQGLSYWSAYVLWLTEFADALRTSTSVDIYKRPFFRNTGHLPVYFQPPYARRGAFGDGNEGRPSLGQRLLIGKFAVAFQDPVLAWHAGQIEAESGERGRSWNEWFMEDVHSVLDGGPSGLQETPPADLPGSRWLRDTGWVAAHSALGDAENDVWLLFKSSRFGSFSHSHGDQNSFQLNAFGEPLLIDSGYYPWYGSPHHSLWTRQTLAHNAVLINRRGQPPFNMAARGTVEYCDQVGSVTRMRANAAEAYNVASSPEIVKLWEETLGTPHPSMEPRAEVVRRSLAFVASQPSPWIVVHDFVRTSGPTHFQYLFHAMNEMQVDSGAGAVGLGSGGARLAIRLVSDAGLRFSQSGEFNVPPEERYEGAPGQYHLTAETGEERSQVKFLAVLVPYRDGEPEPVIEMFQSENRLGFEVGAERVTAWWGEGEAGQLEGSQTPARMVIETIQNGDPARVVLD